MAKSKAVKGEGKLKAKKVKTKVVKSKAVKGEGKSKAKRTVKTKVAKPVKAKNPMAPLVKVRSQRYPGRNPLLMERIGFAFKKLRAMGIVAKRNFQCCGSCGHAAMGKEGYANYVFYHGQAHDRINEGAKGVWLQHSLTAGMSARVLEAGIPGLHWDGSEALGICITAEDEPAELY